MPKMPFPMKQLLYRLSGGRSLRQVIRYGIVGVVQNAVGYGIYLFFTWLGADPKLVVSIAYPIGILISFLGNKK